jgi:hypothetical protein
MIRALWIPGWYELDPHLEVGFDDEFAFWRVVSDNLSAISSWVFYNTIWEQGQGIFATGKITAIRHPELGEIRKIDTRGLDYTITLADGVEQLVNAEEEPGKTYERQHGDWVASSRSISDWQFEVIFESLSEPTSERTRRRAKR